MFWGKEYIVENSAFTVEAPVVVSVLKKSH